MKGVEELTPDTVSAAVSEVPLYALDFWSEWCIPCKAVGDAMKELSDVFADRVGFGSLDVGRYPDFATEFGVSSVPTIILLRFGSPVRTLVGARSRRHLELELEKALSSPPGDR